MKALYALSALLAAAIGLSLWMKPEGEQPAAAVPAVRHETGAPCLPGGEVAAVLRNDGDGWHAIEDDGHAPINVRAVESDDRAITVHFAFTAQRIHTFIVSTDETLALAGFLGGASVAMTDATIWVAQLGPSGFVRMPPADIHTKRFPQSNLWIYGRFAADCN
jgi:hypothetical protein